MVNSLKYCLLIGQFIAELYDVGQLLRVDVDSLRSGLLTKHLELGDDCLVTELSSGEADHVRDSLCRTLYARLFTYLVSRINEALKVGSIIRDGNHYALQFALIKPFSNFL